jgi:uncharacterized membrane protein HdeD (DUF308 family)
MKITFFDPGQGRQQLVLIMAACASIAAGILFLGIPSRPGHLPRLVVGGIWLVTGAIWFFRYWMSRAKAAQRK